MTDIAALAQRLSFELTAEERAELIERLAVGNTLDHDMRLPPRAAGIVFSAAVTSLHRSLNNHTAPSPADLDQAGVALFYGLDGLYGALSAASEAAEGSNGNGSKGMWERAAFDAMNVRDHVAAAVGDGHDWENDDPTYICR